MSLDTGATSRKSILANEIGMGIPEKKEPAEGLQKIGRFAKAVFIDFYLWFASIVSEDAKKVRYLRTAKEMFKDFESGDNSVEFKFKIARKVYVGIAQNLVKDKTIPMVPTQKIEYMFTAMKWAKDNNNTVVTEIQRTYGKISTGSDDYKISEDDAKTYANTYKELHSQVDSAFKSLKSKIDEHSNSITRIWKGLDHDKDLNDAVTDFVTLCGTIYTKDKNMIDTLPAEDTFEKLMIKKLNSKTQPKINIQNVQKQKQSEVNKTDQ